MWQLSGHEMLTPFAIETNILTAIFMTLFKFDDILILVCIFLNHGAGFQWTLEAVVMF